MVRELDYKIITGKYYEVENQVKAFMLKGYRVEGGIAYSCGQYVQAIVLDTEWVRAELPVKTEPEPTGTSPCNINVIEQ